MLPLPGLLGSTADKQEAVTTQGTAPARPGFQPSPGASLCLPPSSHRSIKLHSIRVGTCWPVSEAHGFPLRSHLVPLSQAWGSELAEGAASVATAGALGIPRGGCLFTPACRGFTRQS